MSSPEANVFIPKSVRNRRLDWVFTTLTQGMAWTIAGLLMAIVIIIAIRSLPALQSFGLGFLFSSTWDATKDQYAIFPMVVGTLVSALIGLGLAIPIGIGTAIFLSEDFLPQSLRTGFTFLVELLAAIPSVVYGLWGVFVLVPLLKPLEQFLYDHLGWFPLFSTPPRGPGLLPASLILAVMVLPVITAISRDSLSSIPSDLRQAAFGIGATRWEVLSNVLLPASASGITGGVMLALGRAMGETMAVTLVIGNANHISPSLFAPSTTISSLLANQFAEASGLKVSALMYAALVLFVITLCVNVMAEIIVDRFKHKY